MYHEKIETIALSHTGILFKDSDGEVIPETTLISDLAYKLENTGSPYIPDYAVRGYYKMINHYSVHEFYINPEGSHILFITGTPKSMSDTESKKFRCQSSLWVSYWEDTKNGYLFQITEK